MSLFIFKKVNVMRLLVNFWTLRPPFHSTRSDLQNAHFFDLYFGKNITSPKLVFRKHENINENTMAGKTPAIVFYVLGFKMFYYRNRDII